MGFNSGFKGLMVDNVLSKIIPHYEVMWKNILQSDRPQIIIWRMRIAYRIPKATNTHS